MVDYHDPTWVDAAATTSGADGFDAAVNAALGGAASRCAASETKFAARAGLATAPPGAGGHAATLTY